MQMHYLYRDYPGAMEWAERGLLLLPSIESQVGEWQFVFYYALTAAALAGQATAPHSSACWMPPALNWKNSSNGPAVAPPTSPTAAT
jgi:hypothetical protein